MRNLNRFHLNALRAVEAVGRLGSLRAAAEEIGVTVGAVSQQILKTEEQIGCPLFERLPSGLKPTPLGRKILRHLSDGFSELSTAIAQAEKERDHVLNVSVAPAFASKWLVWRLPRFNQLHPDIRLRIDAQLGLVNPSTSDVDVCIRLGQGDWPGVNAEKLLDHRVFPVCSPSLAGRLRSPADLANVPIIRDPNAMFGWDAWLAPNGYDESILGDGPVFSSPLLCLDAAMAGQGVFLAWETLACDTLEAGGLVAPFPDRRGTGLSYWFVTARGDPPSRAVRALRAWLTGELAAMTTGRPRAGSLVST